MSSSEELVQLATINFQNKNYKDCIIILKELLKSNSDDPKILHNLAVAEYYYKQEKKQKEALNEILQKTINENKEIIDNNKLDIIKFLNDSNDLLNNFELNGYLTSQKNKEIDNEIVSQNQDNSEKSLEKESVNELDLDLADNQDDMEEDSLKLSNLPLLLSDIIYELYNTSVIYFNERKYKEAVELLEPSFSNIEALDDYIALKISFLLIDLYLELGNSEKAIAVLELSQKIYKRNIEEMKCMENEDGDSSINSSLKDIDHSSSKSDIDKNEYNDSNVSSLSLSTVLLKNINITSPDIKAALPSKFNTFNAFYYYQKARINIKNNELDEAKKNMELSLRINQNEPLSVEPINEEEMVAADFMSSNGSDKDKKEMGEAQNNYYQLENVINNLNATLAYNDENMKESFSLLASQPRGEDYIYNNLGCVSYQEKKYSLAENFFLKALKENEQLLKEQQLKGQIEENDQEEDKKQENQTEQQLEQSTEQDQNGKQTEEDKESLIENKTSDEYKIKKLPSILHNLELQYMIHNNFEMAIKCLLQDRRQDKNDTISLENIFYWLRAGEIFLRIYRNKTYSTDPKNIMKVYRISPEIIYGFINNKARTISPLGEDNEFKELNKM
ncbi:TPR-like protein [Piromyces finnis]|uniref:TPR-like protein n=1 Tax=Piromyces finnis TaxID=1754191 RepID=A0A1Y1V330_9FUNG|nr:TPR-like protein [Piromyces finnis]|eukprot:ORX46201.1 TPR-like protein [Piromyces finnis]